MQNIQKNPEERGSAILMVLGMLSILLTLALVFAVTSRNAQTMADANADQTKARLLSKSAANHAEEAISFFQNKGNILGNDSLDESEPATADIDQSPTTADAITGEFSSSEYYYGKDSGGRSDFLGLQPYIGYVDATANWKQLCLYGEFSQSEKGTAPFSLSGDHSYQSIYYTHSDDSYDEETEDENSLYSAITSTFLGEAYSAATSQFEALLKGSGTTQLQFKNILDEDGKIASRYGFVVFCDGSKFDLNQLIRPAMPSAAHDEDMYIPYVDEGELGSSATRPGKNAQLDTEKGASKYAVMGYAYETDGSIDTLYIDGSDDDHAKLIEDETVQYGLHPQELQTRIVSDKVIYQDKDAILRGDKDKPPRWMTYDMLTKNADSAIKDAFLATNQDIFLYCLDSGKEDREFRFNGHYPKEDELLNELDDNRDGNFYDTKNYALKANIAFPWGLYEEDGAGNCDFGVDVTTWDDIGNDLAALSTKNDWKTRTEHFFKEHLGLDYDSSDPEKYLFKNNADEDVTQQVFANLVDFCDSLSDLTYGPDENDRKLEWTASDFNQVVEPGDSTPFSVDDYGEPMVCGNERAAALVGFNVTFEEESSTLNVTKANDKNCHSMTISAGQVTLKPTFYLDFQNFLNEKLENVRQKFRVILKGKAVPFMLVQQVKAKQAGDPAAVVSTEYRSGLVAINKNALNFAPIGESFTNSMDDDYGLTPNALSDKAITLFNANATEFCVDFIRDESTTTYNYEKLQNKRFSFSPNDTVKICELLSSQTLGSTSYSENFVESGVGFDTENCIPRGSGFAVQLEKAIVLVYNADIEAVEEFAYAENGSRPWTVISKTDSTSTTWGEPVRDANLLTVDGAVCKDPRMNHSSADWKWLDDANFTALECEGAYGLISDAKKDNLKGSQFADIAIQTVKDTLENDDRDEDMDWEPDFNPTLGTDDKLSTTLSTYFIPNYPITSLWQLGAVHRGEIGQTLNLKKFGTDAGVITHEYKDGDAWLLDYLRLNELDEKHGIQGKFNPNCFNTGSYRYLFANIPANDKAEDTLVYANGMLSPLETDDEIVRNDFFTDFIDASWSKTTIDWEDKVFHFMEVGAGKDYTKVKDIQAAQSWSPVQAFFNFVDINGGSGSGSTVQCNDRVAESLIGCTAGLLSTRYELFTVVSVGQELKYILPDSDMPTEDADRNAFLAQLASPVKINTDWYSVLATEKRLVTLVRDCWFGKITVLKSQPL